MSGPIVANVLYTIMYFGDTTNRLYQGTYNYMHMMQSCVQFGRASPKSNELEKPFNLGETRPV